MCIHIRQAEQQQEACQLPLGTDPYHHEHPHVAGISDTHADHLDRLQTQANDRRQGQMKAILEQISTHGVTD